ncbi:YraN family protein [Deinococcus aquiradiocola]|uniref:UPF0102 protein GCM10008939_30090 n=1 Tax=Deinococcus aquiradiocola TaxID=393059 RepID=A0A917PM79_9DEIO|nr:YraN family protein [Deinococcus aquiradiocola]GGJ84185.1 UPF0102 protein [Deinococcus aquiradiocola]
MKGAHAEDRALAHLLAAGHTLLARNYRVPGGELDLVTLDGPVTVFTEVRQRRGVAHGSALESVTPRKVALLRRAALTYLTREHGRDDLPCRFDVIVVQGDERSGPLTHLQNALD